MCHSNVTISKEDSSELAGLRAILTVIRAVAAHNYEAGYALCEHPNWAPLQSLLDLVSFSIPICLKADIFLTLAALGKSKKMAFQLWVNLEASQIIKSSSTNSSITASRGIENEIVETEHRNATYPLAQSILELLYTLSRAIIPRNLGVGSRKPGIKPYFNFILETIFLKFYNRYVIKG